MPSIDTGSLPPGSPRRILVLRAGALGDTLVALPALAALRGRYPDARLALVGNPSVGPLLQAAGNVDEAHSVDARWVTDLYSGEHPPPELRARLAEVDLAVVWSRNPGTPVVGALHRLGIPTLAAASFPPPGVRRHLCEHLLDTLAPLALPTVDPIPRLGIPDADLALARDFWREKGLDGKAVVAFHVGSGSPRKNWPAERFAAVADRLHVQGRQVLLLSGPADETQSDAFRQSARSQVVEARSPRLSHLAALLARADAYLGNDSGVSHLAAAVGAPTVAIFGPTDPALWAPRGVDGVIVLWRGGRWAPADDLRGGQGELGGPTDEVTVDQVSTAIETLVRRPLQRQ